MYDLLERRLRRAHRGAEQLAPPHLEQLLGLAPLGEEVLEGHVPRRALSADPDLATGRFVRAVLALREDPRVGLSAHGLGAEGAGEQVDGLALEGAHRVGEGLEQPHLERRVLLRRDALALVSVVVHARLAVSFGEDRRALPEGDEVALAQLVELPAHERVVVRVVVGRDERTTPVDPKAETDQVGLASRWEVLEPVDRVDKGKTKFDRLFP